MNIFVTNRDPIIAAQELCDAHVQSKMIIESAIMLAHCFPQETLNHSTTPKTATGKSRKSGRGYYNHICSKWVRESQDNYMWLVEHALSMCRERATRFPNRQRHFTQTFIDWCAANLHNTTLTQVGLTPFVVAIKDGSTCKQIKGYEEMPVEVKYQQYIIHDKLFATWTNQREPLWYQQDRCQLQYCG